jgi:hypothetical protein
MKMDNLHVVYSPINGAIYIVEANPKMSKGNMIVADDKIDRTDQVIETVMMYMDEQIKEGDNALEIIHPNGKLIWERK